MAFLRGLDVLAHHPKTQEARDVVWLCMFPCAIGLWIAASIHTVPGRWTTVDGWGGYTLDTETWRWSLAAHGADMQAAWTLFGLALWFWSGVLWHTICELGSKELEGVA